MSRLKIAIAQGPTLKETIPLLAMMGLEPLGDVFAPQQQVMDTSSPDVQLVVVRGADVSTYVDGGAVDMGIVGNDRLAESDGNYREMLDLQVAQCQLVCAASKRDIHPRSHQSDGQPSQPIKVATKYLRTAKAFYAEQGRDAHIIPLTSAQYLAPQLNLADEIVDLVCTGKTLERSGLEIRHIIAAVSARVIANHRAIQMKPAQVEAFVDTLASVLGDREAA